MIFKKLSFKVNQKKCFPLFGSIQKRSFLNPIQFFKQHAVTENQKKLIDSNYCLQSKKDLETPHFGDHNRIIQNPKLFDTFKVPKASRQEFPFEFLEMYTKFKRIDGKKIDWNEKIAESKHKMTFVYFSKYPIYSVPYLLQWMRPFKQRYPDINLLMIGMQESNLYFYISWILRRSVSKRLTEEEKKQFFVVYDNRGNTISRLFYEKLNLKNRFGAYFFLLDEKGKVCLRGSGNATEKDLDLLYETVSEILEQNKKE